MPLDISLIQNLYSSFSSLYHTACAFRNVRRFVAVEYRSVSGLQFYSTWLMAGVRDLIYSEHLLKVLDFLAELWTGFER